MTDQGSLLKFIEDYLADYNMQSKARMDLVLFQYAAEHVCIIKQPLGNALLIRTFHRLGADANKSWPSAAAILWPPHTAPSSPVQWPSTSVFISCAD